jgi:hypothetical protein
LRFEAPFDALDFMVQAAEFVQGLPLPFKDFQNLSFVEHRANLQSKPTTFPVGRVWSRLICRRSEPLRGILLGFSLPGRIQAFHIARINIG